MINFVQEDIEGLIAEGNSASTIAKLYNCSVSSVYNFCRSKNIKWPEKVKVGDKFNKFEVIERLESRSGSVYWKCRCECGNVRELPTKSITREEYVSCGCYISSKERSRSNPLWSGYEDIHGKWWRNVERGATRRGHEFNISMEYVWELYVAQDKKCALSGLPISFSKTTRGWQRGGTTASIDRIDSTLGYVEGNVHWVHKDINLMKQKLSMDEFMYYCKLVTNYRK